MTDRSKPLPPEYWLGLATEDLACATAFLDMESAQPRHSVGLASQAAEKALKAAVASLGVVPPRSHDLVALAHRSAAILRVTVSEHDLRRLSDAHEQARYPASSRDLFDHDEAIGLTRVADTIVNDVTAALHAAE
jgi:HEPN domain-containing protein